MGEIADGFLDGTFCQSCGVYLEDGSPGYPRLCPGCAREKRHTVDEWEKIDGVEILDPDGFRDLEDWDTLAFTRQEWESRMVHCTLRDVRPVVAPTTGVGKRKDHADVVEQVLKPCPFCGSEYAEASMPMGLWRVRCGGCGASAMGHMEKDGAEEKWNMRTQGHADVIELVRNILFRLTWCITEDIDGETRTALARQGCEALERLKEVQGT